MQRCVITRNFSHVPVTLLRTECLYGAIRRSILSLYYILLIALEAESTFLEPLQHARSALTTFTTDHHEIT